MKATKVAFKEKKRDIEGNVELDKKTGLPLYIKVQRVVRHNPAYLPK